MKKVKVNRSIYSDETIRMTIEAYLDHAVISTEFCEDYAILTFWKCKYDDDLTVKEFENYMIGIENS